MASHVLNPISDHPAEPPAVRPDDASLAQAVRAALAAEGRLADAALTVTVERGLVSLDGSVPLEFQRQLADAVAGSVPGVLVLLNRLDVAETALNERG